MSSAIVMFQAEYIDNLVYHGRTHESFSPSVISKHTEHVHIHVPARDCPLMKTTLTLTVIGAKDTKKTDHPARPNLREGV